MPEHPIGHIRSTEPLGERPLVGFRTWRIVDGVLQSRFTGTPWTDGRLHAECLPRRAEDLLQPPHSAPHPGCRCGIYLDTEPRIEICGVDAHAAVGLVRVAGLVVADASGIRCEQAQVEAIGVYRQWSSRQRAAAASVASDIGCDLLAAEELPALALALGSLPLAPRFERARAA